MKIKSFAFLLLMACFLGFSQEKDLEYIKKEVEVHTIRDTIRVNLLNQLTRYYATRDISKNEAILNEAINISKEIDYTKGLADSYTNLTSFYVQSGNYDQALNLALKVKKTQDSIEDITGLIYTNSSIARIYNHLEESNKAIEIQLENLELLKENPNKNMQAQVHFYLATAYEEIENYDEAEVHYLAAKQIAESVNFETGIIIANSSLGVLENKRENYKSAINYLNQSLSFFKKNNQVANVAHTNLELAVAYANTGRVNEAIIANEKAIKVYQEQSNIKSLSRSYLEQSDYYKRKKDYLKSNKYLEEHYKIKDSVFAKEKLSIMEEMQTKYETEKVQKEKELAEQETAITKLESQKNRNLFLGSITVAGLLLLASLFYFERVKAKKKAELMAIELQETQKRLVIEQQYRDSEIKAITSQMNPHFIFNALNSIQDYIIHNEQKLARKYLVKFSRLIRIYLEHSQKQTISLQEEIDALQLYLDLEKARFEDSFLYTINVSKKLNSQDITIPTFLIQPHVENAIKHGLLHRKSNRKLDVLFNLNVKKTMLICTIKDNGIGRDASLKINAKRIKPKSFSSEANKKRIDLFNKTNANPIHLEIVDNYDESRTVLGTTVLISIPIT